MMKNIFEQLAEKQNRDVGSEAETYPNANKTSHEYLDYIEGRVGKRGSGTNGSKRRPTAKRDANGCLVMPLRPNQ